DGRVPVGQRRSLRPGTGLHGHGGALLFPARRHAGNHAGHHRPGIGPQMSEVTNTLPDTSARLLGDLVTRDVLAGAEAGAWPADLWAALEENGLTRALPPEDLGGLGAGFDAAFVIAFAAGKARAPVPLPETLAAGWLLGRAGIEQ